MNIRHHKGSFHGIETIEICILLELSKKINIGLYRNDSLMVLRNSNRQNKENQKSNKNLS